MNAVAKSEESTVRSVQPVVELTPMMMLQIAVQQNADLDKLTKLMDLQERWEANTARKAYVTAMAAFKADPPEIFKNKHVAFATSRGTTEYDHATHDHVSSVIGAALSKHAFSHRWEGAQANGVIIVTCVITHVGGHSERTTLESSADDSGGKNSIQAIGSAVTYLQRYTLLAATGLGAKDQDDDGKGAGGGRAADCITANQVADLLALITEVGTNEAKFLRLLKVEALEQILSCNYSIVLGLLEAKRK